MTTTISPAIWYARIFGVVLTIIGILGLAITTNQNAVEPLLGFDVNLTHNIVHLATGALGLIAGFMILTSARMYALVLGIVYALLGVWGLVEGEGFNPLGLFESINMADNMLHLAVGIAGLAAWGMSRTVTEGETTV